MADGPEWFAPKRYGWGAGRPIAWQGWLVLGVAFVLGMVVVLVFQDRPDRLVAAIIPIGVVLMVITARTTRGGWRWRWGKED